MITGAIASDIAGSYFIDHPSEVCTLSPLPRTAHPTGDSVIILAAAEWLIEDSGHTPEILIEYLHKWGRKFADLPYTDVLMRLLNGKDTGNGTPDTIPTLCAIPIGLYAKNIDEALQLSEISAKATCTASGSIKDAQAIAAIVHLTHNGKSKEEIRKYIGERFDTDTTSPATPKESIGTATEAMRIFLGSNTFEETLHRALSSGCHTAATLSGAMASARAAEGYKIDKKFEREIMSHLPSRMINCIYTFNHLLDNPTIETPIRNSYKVDERIYAGEYPATSSEKLGRRDIDRFIRFGITHFIDLTERGELLPYTQWLHENQTHIRFAIKDCGIPGSNHEVAQLLETITSILKEKNNMIYIHCRGGIGRTGTIVACYYAMFLKEYTPVYNLLRRQFSQCPKSAYRETPETMQQKRFIMQFTDYMSKR